MMRRPRSFLALVGLAALAVGCEDEVVRPAITAPSASASAKGPAAAGKGAPGASAGPAARVEISEAEFTETERSRDPFRTFTRRFLEEARGRARSQREVVLAQYGVDELKLIGIVTRIQPAKAMLVDPTGKGHVIQRGQFVGRPDVVQTTSRSGATYEINWRVDRIRDGDIVLVREDPNNPDVPAATKVIPLRPEGTVLQGK